MINKDNQSAINSEMIPLDQAVVALQRLFTSFSGRQLPAKLAVELIKDAKDAVE